MAGGLELGYWREGILAADAADWITVAAYGVAALLAGRAAGAARGHRRRRERAFWRAGAALMLLLGINEIFDFQTLLTAIGVAYAQSAGFYEQRRAFQAAFLAALVVAAVVAGLALLRATRRTDPTVRVGLAGLVFIGAFVLIRAASFHHADALLGLGPRAFNFGSMQEMAGIAIFAAAAWAYPRRVR